MENSSLASSSHSKSKNSQHQRRFQRSNSRVFKKDQNIRVDGTQSNTYKGLSMATSYVLSPSYKVKQINQAYLNQSETQQKKNSRFQNEENSFQERIYKSQNQDLDKSISKFIKFKGKDSENMISLTGFNKLKECLVNKQKNTFNSNTFNSKLNEKKPLKIIPLSAKASKNYTPFAQKSLQISNSETTFLKKEENNIQDKSIFPKQKQNVCPTKRKSVAGYKRMSDLFSNSTKYGEQECKKTEKIISSQCKRISTCGKEETQSNFQYEKQDQSFSMELIESNDETSKYMKINRILQEENKELKLKNNQLQLKVIELTTAISAVQNKIAKNLSLQLNQYSKKIRKISEDEQKSILEQIKIRQSFREISQECIIADLKKQLQELAEAVQIQKQNEPLSNMDKIISNIYQENRELKEQLENMNLKVWAMDWQANAKSASEEKIRKLQLQNRYNRATVKESVILIEKLKSENDKLRKQNRCSQLRNPLCPVSKVLDSSSLSLSFSLC